jgi:plasminogen activator inhibitor 1 RNA-binding protein
MFDRRDASGRRHETEKRHGGGKGNWGAEIGEEEQE